MATDYNYLFKLVLVGDSGVGKTSLLLRYTDDTFTINHIATIGVDFKIKTMDMGDSNSRTRLQVWDTAGQDRFKTIVASFYRGADGLIVVFDVTEMESFEHVTQWFKEAQQSGNEEKLCSRLLIGNKSDLTAKRTVPFDTAQALADKMGVPYIETSAKDTTNVEQAFTSMAHRIFEVKKTNPPLLEDSNGRLNELDHLGKLRKGYWVINTHSGKLHTGLVKAWSPTHDDFFTKESDAAGARKVSMITQGYELGTQKVNMASYFKNISGVSRKIGEDWQLFPSAFHVYAAVVIEQ